MFVTYLIVVLLLVTIPITIYKSIKIVPPEESIGLIVLGDYKGLLDSGYNIVPPFISSYRTVNIQVREIDLPRQTVQTKDNNRVTIGVSVYARVDKPEKFISTVDDFEEKIWKIGKSQTSEIIVNMDASNLNADRGEISTELEGRLQDAVQDWGISIERVEITEISI